MKRFFWVTLGVASAAILAGCPIYSDNVNRRVCNNAGCYDCANDFYSDSCSPWQCNTASDCPSGYACDSNNACVSGPSYDGGNPPGSCTSPSDCATGNCGTDGQCHPGDCSNTGCPSGYQCKLSNGTLQCVGGAVRDGGSSDGGRTDGGVSGCQSDAQCSALGAGAKCLDGTCVKPADQCSDATQCPNNEQCVQGVCTPSCGAQAACPVGYACDPTKGVCTGNPGGGCGGGLACTSGTVCVEQHCVTPCGAGNTCPTALVCVNGGCIPDQKPQFVCGADGVPGNGAPGNCALGSLCLHHNCYIACATDAGIDGGGCRAADKFNTCKQVSASGNTYEVCGSSSNLGSECDPTVGKACTDSTKVCIDGYCK